MKQVLRSKREQLFRLGRLASALILPLAVVFAIWVIARDSPATLREIRLKPVVIFLSFLIECSGLLIAIPIWHRILAAYGISHSLTDDLRIYCYSALGLILPGGIWSIVSRAVLYRRLGRASGLRVGMASIVEMLLLGVAGVVVYAAITVVRPTLALFRQPVFAYVIAVVAIALVYPGVFNRLSRWAVRRSGRLAEPIKVDFGLRELLAWIGLEAIVTITGGLALSVLLSSFVEAPGQLVLPVVAAWAAASAVGNLLFWLPGTPLVRDSAMVAALTLVVPLPSAILFVGIQRIWTIMSLLCVAGLVWLALDRSTNLFGQS